MIDLNSVGRQLLSTELELTGVTFHGQNEIRVIVPRDQIGPLSDYVRERLCARPELILAEDTREKTGSFTLRYIFEVDQADVFVVATVSVPAEDRTFPSLAARWYLASRFEREIHDLFGLMPVDHPDLRRLPRHQFWPEQYHPLLKNAVVPEAFTDDGKPFPFRRVEGEGLFEITVGPVHAGTIEPGHFRFSVDGETIINLESRLYFAHKGIEKLFESMPIMKGVVLAERISGDASIGHASAFCQAIEAIAGVHIPRRAAYLRVVLLELERLYNHIADIGAICTDTGFAFANAHAMRLREELLRLNQRLVGHRLLRGCLTPGGLLIDISPEQAADVSATVARVLDDFNEIVGISLGNGLLLDRLHGTGRLTTNTAREMQVVGIAARASGIDADARRDHPFAAYGSLSVRVPVLKSGDVWARLMVRVEEATESARLITTALQTAPSGEVAVQIESLPSGACGFSIVESWRGPIWHWITMGDSGQLGRVKIKDPSFANWPALNYAILKNIVPDFPLINKSFNLSYAGNDL